MRVVLDTNVIVSRYISPTGKPARIVEGWRAGAFGLLVSEPILLEYQRVLQYDRLRTYHRLSDVQIAAIVVNFREFASLVQPAEALRVVMDDPDDDKLLECAVGGHAEIIVSGDPHLLKLRTYRGVQILSPAAFLTFLEHRDESG